MFNVSKLIILALLLLALPQHSFAQDKAAPSNPTLEQVANLLADKLPAKHLKIVVMDFSAPDKRWLPLSAYLADEFSAALAKRGAPFEIVDRKKLSAQSDFLNARPEKQFDSETRDKLEKLVRADCIVSGSYGEFNGSLGITVGATVDGDPRPAAQLNTKISLTPEMTAQLDAPLESLRPEGNLPPLSGTGGMTVPSCTECPFVSISGDYGRRKFEATVLMSVIVSPEGQVTTITVTKSFNEALDKDAIAGVKKWRFTPALDPDGKPAAVRQVVEVTFHLY